MTSRGHTGKHQFKFGGQFIQLRDNRVFGAYENPVELLGTDLGSGLTNLMNGTIYQFSGAVDPQGEYPCPKNAAGVTQSLSGMHPDFASGAASVQPQLPLQRWRGLRAGLLEGSSPRFTAQCGSSLGVLRRTA